MEREILEKAKELDNKISNLKMSLESLTYYTKDIDNPELRIYVNKCYNPFIVPSRLGKRVVDLLFELLINEIKKSEQQFKAL